MDAKELQLLFDQTPDVRETAYDVTRTVDGEILDSEGENLLTEADLHRYTYDAEVSSKEIEHRKMKETGFEYKGFNAALGIAIKNNVSQETREALEAASEELKQELLNHKGNFMYHETKRLDALGYAHEHFLMNEAAYFEAAVELALLEGAEINILD